MLKGRGYENVGRLLEEERGFPGGLSSFLCCTMDEFSVLIQQAVPLMMGPNCNA